MDERHEQDDRRAIARLLAEYCHLCDDGDFDALVDRFTIDGSFVLFGQETTGREALRRWYEEMQRPERRGKHITGNMVVDVHGDRATAASDFVFVARVDGRLAPLMAGRYVDELHRHGGRWLIGRREALTI